MQYQSFRGGSVREALGRVRAQLGRDAWIASTRRLAVDEAVGEGGPVFEVLAAPGWASGEKASGRRRPRKAGKFEEVRRLVEELGPPRQGRYVRELLHSAGLEGSVVHGLEHGVTADAISSEAAARTWLRARLAERLQFRSGLIEEPGPRAIACVGPSGVGKTTTLAKLAAIARFELGRRVHVVSLDSFRVGAVEQWHRFAELIGFSFGVADNPGSFHRQVHTQPHDLLLVDTSGARLGASGSQLLEDCSSGLALMEVDVLLALPAWLRGRDAERLVTDHSGPSLTGIVITKMDETDQLGGVLHAPIVSGLPLTYLCHGACVPEDIREAHADVLMDAVFPESA